MTSKLPIDAIRVVFDQFQSGGSMKQQRETFPSAIEATFLVICLYVLEFLIGAVFHDVKNLSGIDPRDAAGVIVVLGNGILFSVLLYYKELSYSSLFHSSKTSVAAVIGTLSAPILCLIPGITIVMWTIELVLVTLFPLAGWQQAMFDQMMSNGLASVVTLLFIAPFLEEMLFRGVILRSFLLQYSRWHAIFGSAFLFGLAHLNIYQFVVGLALGTLSGWLYERTKSLWPSILLHGSYNAAITILYYLTSPEEMFSGWQPPVPYWIIALVFAFAGMSLLQRLLVVRRAPP
ncbi:CPBP family intramembrane glutamic endopeptidase [Dechloromonas denitrificans]|uniref:CPBP family intramembrane glutamic endopeptidase n=1 Tax=Dechloromonas denitrificans TaxID=281362 RepID=UPI001CF99FDD|nr:CPBP family intramembrane glutamic endopeptidase [Dechloromonas denitrificans]UCV07021.1 CPBP family intramembrane metalloprotease [Dechloromonas denitrificans]